jgi:hypothetical protein
MPATAGGPVPLAGAATRSKPRRLAAARIGGDLCSSTVPAVPVGSPFMGTSSGGLDSARLRAIAASDRPLAPHECAERARLAAALIEPGRLDRSGPGEAVLLWRDEHSEAWLNLWWQPRDTGYHDHTGSCVGVHVIDGRAWNERAPHHRRAAAGARVRPGRDVLVPRRGHPPDGSPGRGRHHPCVLAADPGHRPLRPPRRPAAPYPRTARPAIPTQRRALRGAPPARWRRARWPRRGG